MRSDINTKDVCHKGSKIAVWFILVCLCGSIKQTRKI